MHRRAGEEDLGARRRLGQARHGRGRARNPRGHQRPRRRTWASLHEGALADAAAVDKVIDAAVAAVAARRGIAVALPSTGGGGGATVDAAALGEFTEQITGRDGVLASAARLVLGQLGLDDPVSVPPTATDAELIDLVTAESGSDWPRLVAPVFDGKKAVVFDDRWASAREDLAKLWLVDDDEVNADWARLSERFEGAGHVVATQATWWQGKALAAGRQIHASLYGRIAAGAENPDSGHYSDEVAVVTGASKGSIAASVVGRLLDGGAHRHRDDVQARRRAAGLLPHAVPRPRPLRRDAVGGGGQHGVLLRHRRAGRMGRQRADRKPWAAVDSHQGRADPDTAVPVRGAAGRRRPVRGRFALGDGNEGAAVGGAAADRRAVQDRCRARHRLAAARGAARLAEPRHVRRRRRLRRGQVRAGRRGYPVEGRVVVGAAS